MENDRAEFQQAYSRNTYKMFERMNQIKTISITYYSQSCQML